MRFCAGKIKRQKSHNFTLQLIRVLRHLAWETKLKTSEIIHTPSNITDTFSRPVALNVSSPNALLLDRSRLNRSNFCLKVLQSFGWAETLRLRSHQIRRTKLIFNPWNCSSRLFVSAAYFKEWSWDVSGSQHKANTITVHFVCIKMLFFSQNPKELRVLI